MSTLRDDLLSVVNDARTLVDQLGMHQVLISIKTRVWSSGRLQTGTPTDTVLVIVPTPHVIGTSGDPEITCGPLTPAYPATWGVPAGGYTPAQLNPAMIGGQEYYYQVTFNDGITRQYVLQPNGLNTDRAMRIMAKLRTLDRRLPF